MGGRKCVQIHNFQTFRFFKLDNIKDLLNANILFKCYALQYLFLYYHTDYKTFL